MANRAAASIYRLLHAGPTTAPSVRAMAVAMIALAAALAAVGVVRVEHQHEILELGYRLAQSSERVTGLREEHRRLELERATLSAPERIRKLATELGMTPVEPDKIRVITAKTIASAALTPAGMPRASFDPRRPSAALPPAGMPRASFDPRRPSAALPPAGMPRASQP